MTVRRQPSRGDNKPAAKQSWRKGAGAKPTSEKLWSSTATTPDIWLTRSFKLFAAAVLLIATAGGVIAYLTRTDDKASLLVLAIDDYHYPWAPNAWAKEDANWLDDRLDEQAKKLNVIVAQELPEQKSIEEWIQFQLESDHFTAGGPGGSTIWRSYSTAIVYLSAHFAVDQESEPCLMVPTAMCTDAWQSATPVRLEKVLETISNHSKLQPTQFRSVRKLVVLDLGKQPHNMTLGRSNDALHASIQRVIEAQTDRNMAVILSCSNGQRAWTVPEFGGSNFGIWFAQGLSGAADRNRNGRVGLKELVDYLTNQVNQLANVHRAAIQEPVCFFPTGNPIDFDLSFAMKIDPEVTPTTSTANLISSTFAQDLDKQWTEFETWKEIQLGYDPWRVSEVNGRLVRADQLLIAGPSHAIQLREELAKISELMAPAPKWPISVGGRSRAPQIDSDWSAVGKESQKPSFDWLDQVTVDGKAPEKPPAISEAHAHLAAWTWLMKNRDLLDIEKLKRVRRMLTEAIPDSPATLHSRDRLLLRSLVDRFHLMSDSSARSGEPISSDRWKSLVRILDAHRQLEEVYDIQDPRLGNWLVNQKGLLQTHLAAIDYWFVGSPESFEKCDRLLDTLFGDLVDSRTSKMKQAIEVRKKLEASWKLHDEMVYSLPRMQWIVDNQNSLFLDQRRKLRESFSKLVDELKELHARLEDLSNQDLPQYESHRNRWDTAKGLFFSSFVKLVPENEVDASSCRDILLWLEQSIATRAETRAVLRNRLVEHLKSDLKDFHTKDAKSLSMAFEFPALETFDENSSVDLLRSVLSIDWKFDEKNPSLDTRAWQLHQKVWEESIVQSKIENRVSDMGAASKQAWQAQVVAAWVAQCPSTAQSVNAQCPTRSRWSSAAQLALLGRADFAREDFWIAPTDTNIDESSQNFAKIAQNWIEAARSKNFIEGQLGVDVFKDKEGLLQKSSIASVHWKDDFWNEVPKQPVEGSSVSIAMVQPSKNLPLGVAMLEHPITSKPESVSPDKPTPVKIDLALVTSSAATLRGNFRGRSTEFNLAIKRPTANLELAWNVSKVDATKIQVSADEGDRQILFVLDCSNSLSRDTLEKAKTTILAILARLPANTEVGLVAFGHSASWVEAKSYQVEFNLPFFHADRRDPNQLSPKRTPENDVDLLVPFQKLSDQTVTSFQDKLDSLEPFGFTPLYYAMKFSLDYQQSMRGGAKQNLVVITDGNNNVTRGDKGAELGLPLRPEFLVTKEIVRSEIDRVRGSLQLDVIAYQFERNGSSVELETLAGIPHFHKATSKENELLGVVRKILELRTYDVRVDREPASQTDFGTSKTIRTGKPSRIQISIQDTEKRVDLVALGGEFLDAKYDAGRNQLRFNPLGEQFKDACEIEAGGKQVRIGTLIGVRKGSTQYIRAAIQSVAPQQPSVRPRRMWVELEVRSSDDAKSKRVIGVSDVQWETNNLAPVFQIPILHGVPERMRVWLAFDESKFALSLPLSKWEIKGAREFPEVDAPIAEAEGGKGWTLSFAQPFASRLAWSLEPEPDARIEYSVGTKQQQKYWYRTRPEDDIAIRIEKMPASDRPNSGGWSTSEWLTIPRE